MDITRGFVWLVNPTKDCPTLTSNNHSVLL